MGNDVVAQTREKKTAGMFVVAHATCATCRVAQNERRRVVSCIAVKTSTGSASSPRVSSSAEWCTSTSTPSLPAAFPGNEGESIPPHSTQGPRHKQRTGDEAPEWD